MLGSQNLINKIRRIPLSQRRQIVYMISGTILIAIVLIWLSIDLPKRFNGVDKESIEASLSDFKAIGDIKNIVSATKDSAAEEQGTRNFLPVEDKKSFTLTYGDKEKESTVAANEQAINQSVMKENIAIGISTAYKKEDKLAFYIEVVNAGETPFVYTPTGAKLTVDGKDYFPQNNSELASAAIPAGEVQGFDIVFPTLVESGDVALVFPQIPINANGVEDYIFNLKIKLPTQ